MKLHIQLAVMILLSLLGLSMFNSNVNTSTAAIGTPNNSFPSTFYVTFQGYMQPSYSNGPSDGQSLLWVQFLNETSHAAETVLFTFSMEESSKDGFIAKFTLYIDDVFYNEISVPATVSNGRVYIDSTPTIFVVNPDSLTEGNTIEFFQTENVTLSGTVRWDAKTDTLINNYRVASKSITTRFEQTDPDRYFVAPVLFFDPLTGVLTRAANQITDVLLNKLGVDFIVGGVFDLLDYSENLNFTLVRSYYSLVGLIILIIVFVVLFVLVVFFAYRALKKKKRDRRKTYTNKSLKFHFVRYQDMRCLYVL